ncbi:MAG: 30S ribosomal protein S16 [Vicinamibacterales bacterium]|nr:30S ribosomal protein S16 [Vicinamibacterales bacterium]
MLAIRLTRSGSKKRPTYRVVVTEARTPRDSRVVEALGHYNPKTQPATLKVDRERLAHWIGVGAQPSSTVKTLLKKHPEPAAVAIAPTAAPAQ